MKKDVVDRYLILIDLKWEKSKRQLEDAIKKNNLSQQNKYVQQKIKSLEKSHSAITKECVYVCGW